MTNNHPIEIENLAVNSGLSLDEVADIVYRCSTASLMDARVVADNANGVVIKWSQDNISANPKETMASIPNIERRIPYKYVTNIRLVSELHRIPSVINKYDIRHIC